MKSTIIKMGVAHSLPRHERIGLSEPVRSRKERPQKTKNTTPRKKKVRRKKPIKSRRKTSPVKKKRR